MDWAAAYPTPIAIVSFDMKLVWGNGPAQSLFKTGEHFTLKGDVISCADKSQANAFVQHVLLAVKAPRVWIYRAADQSHILVRANGLTPVDRPPATALMIYPVKMTEGYLWADFGPALGLTPGEVLIVKRTMDGERADDIAHALNISLDTVRTHLRRSYSKLSVNSREQLFSRIGPYRVV